MHVRQGLLWQPQQLCVLHARRKKIGSGADVREDWAAGKHQEVADYCAEMHSLQAKISEGFRLSFDHFGRTSTQQQTDVAQAIFWDCHKNGFVTQKARALQPIFTHMSTSWKRLNPHQSRSSWQSHPSVTTLHHQLRVWVWTRVQLRVPPTP